MALLNIEGALTPRDGLFKPRKGPLRTKEGRLGPRDGPLMYVCIDKADTPRQSWLLRV